MDMNEYLSYTIIIVVYKNGLFFGDKLILSITIERALEHCSSMNIPKN